MEIAVGAATLAGTVDETQAASAAAAVQPDQQQQQQQQQQQPPAASSSAYNATPKVANLLSLRVLRIRTLKAAANVPLDVAHSRILE